MADICTVKNCQRFSTVQWVMSLGITAMLGMQGYMIAKVDSLVNLHNADIRTISHLIEVNLNDINNLKLRKEISK